MQKIDAEFENNINYDQDMGWFFKGLILRSQSSE
jgi:hypothetical protein